MEGDQQVQELMSITGLDNQQAQMYLEMSGNNLEVAISMFFEQGDLGGGFGGTGNQESNNQIQQADLVNQEVTSSAILWPNPNNIPESWKVQGIEFDEQNPLGLKQHLNGPCGPLSVINAVLISQLLKKEDFSINRKVTNEELVDTLLAILRISSKNGIFIIVSENNQENEFKSEEEAKTFLLDIVPKFYQKEGGLILFLLSLLHTKGVQAIKQEVLQSGGELPLIVEPFNICTTDLVMLMITGKANGNVGDYDQMTLQKIPIENKLQIGLLSSSVHQMNIPINDALIQTENNVYILHGGEHFTTMFTTEKDLSKETIECYQWNGLKPGGPRMCKFLLKHSGTVVTKNPEPEVYHKSHQQYQPEIGEIDSIIQAKSGEKEKTKDYTKWIYEVAITVHEEKDAKYPKRPADFSKPRTFEQGPVTEGPWRCLACYSKRFETMCFGLNENGATECQHCKLKREFCGWSIYLPYQDLGGFQRSLSRQHGPKIVGILEIKWSGISVEFIDKEEAPTI